MKDVDRDWKGIIELGLILLFMLIVLFLFNGCNTLPPVKMLDTDECDMVYFTSDNISFSPGVYLEGVLYAREGQRLVPVHADIDESRGTVVLYDHKGLDFYELTLWKYPK